MQYLRLSQRWFATCFHAGFLLGLDPEDRDDIFLRNAYGLQCVISQKIELCKILYI
jgi:hypothetical protein